MPSQLLHTLFGEDVIAGIHGRVAPEFGPVADRALEKIRSVYRGAFSLGCQGPDIFYHGRRRRPVGLEYGSLLHRRGAGVFTAGLLTMGLPNPPPGPLFADSGSERLDALGAYALGFMTHAILDRKAHPYIVYKTARTDGGRSSVHHVFFERVLDVLMLRALRGKEAADWDQETVLALPCENPPAGLAELLGRALVRAFPERAGKDSRLPERIRNALADSAGFYRKTSPRAAAESGWKKGLDPEDYPYVLSILFPESLENGSPESGGIDFLNLGGNRWYYPAAGGAEDFRSFPQVYAEAVESAVSSISPVITAYLKTGVFPVPEAARAIGNGGLSVVDEHGRPCGPARSDPLPLDAVLAEQAALRGLV